MSSVQGMYFIWFNHFEDRFLIYKLCGNSDVQKLILQIHGGNKDRTSVCAYKVKGRRHDFATFLTMWQLPQFIHNCHYIYAYKLKTFIGYNK